MSAGGEIALLGGEDPTDVLLFEAQRNTTRRFFTRPPDGGVERVALSGNGRWVAIQHAARLSPADLDDESDVFLIDLNDGAVSLVPDLAVDAGQARTASMSISHDGRMLARTASGASMVYDRLLQQVRSPPDILASSISGDGRSLGVLLPQASTSEQFVLDLVDSRTQLAVPRPFADAGFPFIRGLGPPLLSFDARVRAVGTQHGGFAPGQGPISTSRVVVATAGGEVLFMQNNAQLLALSYDGLRVAYGVPDPNRGLGSSVDCFVVDVPTGEVRFQSAPQHPGLCSILLSGDGKRFVLNVHDFTRPRAYLYVLP